MNTNEDMYRGIRAHIKGTWPGRPHEEFIWTLGPIQTALPDFRVRRIAPSKRKDPWVYLTVGAWEVTREMKHGFEFFLLSPEENPLHVELLAMVTNFHADPRYRLAVGRTIEIGRPWMEGAEADHLLVALPYPYGPEFEHPHLGDRHVRFLWLVPVTRPEAALARRQGLEALEKLLEESGLDVIAPTRPSVV